MFKAMYNFVNDWVINPVKRAVKAVVEFFTGSKTSGSNEAHNVTEGLTEPSEEIKPVETISAKVEKKSPRLGKVDEFAINPFFDNGKGFDKSKSINFVVAADVAMGVAHRVGLLSILSSSNLELADDVKESIVKHSAKIGNKETFVNGEVAELNILKEEIEAELKQEDWVKRYANALNNVDAESAMSDDFDGTGVLKAAKLIK